MRKREYAPLQCALQCNNKDCEKCFAIYLKTLGAKHPKTKEIKKGMLLFNEIKYVNHNQIFKEMKKYLLDGIE